MRDHKIDWRSMFKGVLSRMRDAGESNEMGARWMATEADAAVFDLTAERDRLREENRASKVLLESKDETIRQLTEERAEQWRQRREAEASRDLEKSLSASFRAERDELLEVMKGIEHFSDALSFREDHLSKALRQWIDAGRSIIQREIGE